MADLNNDSSPSLKDIGRTSHERHDNDIESEHSMRGSNSVLACLKFLLCRRAPRVQVMDESTS